jgi:hypothetical protein
MLVAIEKYERYLSLLDAAGAPADGSQKTGEA